MIHKVREWMSNPVIIVDKDSSVSYALTLMRRRNIHSLVVQIDPMAKEYGIITTTDIRDKIIAEEKNPSETAIGDIMTQNLITASPDWNLKECSIIMQANNINHLPVLDENRNLIGLISATDLFIAAEEIGWELG
jgi:acetoin utilization protein AcuB/CBS domain-containing protein